MKITDILFSLDRYTGPENFCDRKDELKQLYEVFNHKRNTVLYSIRRIGKTGLIHHFHHSLNKKRNIVTTYVDMMDTGNDAEFANKLISACIHSLEKKKKGFVQKSLGLFARFRPSISFDPITNAPSIQLDIANPQEVSHSIQSLMELLGEQKYEFQIAIDEFQQISKYEKTKMDATLRSHFQTATNTHYIFSGSEKHLLTGLFFDPSKPLFGSMELMELGYIDREIYANFIKAQFKKIRTSITDEALQEIIEWTQGYTFYTQYFCNKLHGKSLKKITIDHVENIKAEILYQYEVIYINYRKLLSTNQWNTLKAIGQEGQITEYTSKDFLSKYRLSQSSAKQSVEALVNKSMILEEPGAQKTTYKVYDIFLWRWIEKYA